MGDLNIPVPDLSAPGYIVKVHFSFANVDSEYQYILFAMDYNTWNLGLSTFNFGIFKWKFKLLYIVSGVNGPRKIHS